MIPHTFILLKVDEEVFSAVNREEGLADKLEALGN